MATTFGEYHRARPRADEGHEAQALSAQSQALLVQLVSPSESTAARRAHRPFSLLHWLPVGLALLLLAQVTLLGLGPALEESRRLDAAEANLVEHFDREVERGERLDRTARARRDPIYLERERLARQSENGGLRLQASASASETSQPPDARSPAASQ